MSAMTICDLGASPPLSIPIEGLEVEPRTYLYNFI